ncbi:MAG: metallophosphoesterase [Actinobacteria bacterium]|nr:metallophosphoesterase [Actinomycetota bacterium]
MESLEDRSPSDVPADAGEAAAVAAPVKGRRLRRRLRPAGVIVLRLVLVALVVLAAYELVAPESFRIAPGVVTIRVTPALGGGETVVPLGPIGSIGFDTHSAPLKVEVSFVFDEAIAVEDEARALLGDLPAVGATAADALRAYAVGKIPWICLLGLAAGTLIAGVGTLRLKRVALGAGIGLLLLWIIVGSVAAATYAGLNRQPTVTYDGLARYAPRVVSLLQSVVRHPEASGWSVDDLARGLEEVARQATTTLPMGSGDEGIVRLLVAGDLHDNVVGYRLIRRLASDPELDIAAVVLVGDLTHTGTSTEAELMADELRPIAVPVAMVGGNHEAEPALRVFAEAGIIQLARGPTELAGLTLMGFDDPLADEYAAVTDVAERDIAAGDSLLAVRSQVPPPDVVVFHDVGQAGEVIDWAADEELLLTVLYGHSHVASVTIDGSVVVLDPGSGGASGYEQLGRDPGTPYTFQILEYVLEPQRRPIGVVTLRYEGLAGASSAEYQPLQTAEVEQPAAD